MAGFLDSPQMVVLFYATVFILIYLNRTRFEIHAKIVALYKTTVGIRLMEGLAARFGGVIRFVALVLIVPAFLMMGAASLYLANAALKIATNPQAPAEVALILPGIAVPGSPVSLPLWHGLIAIFLVAAMHEFSHGIVAAAHKLRITSTGFFFMGPIPGAFVEPEEKELRKARHRVQHAVFAAGPLSNVLAALLFIGVLLVLPSALARAPFSEGVGFRGVMEGYPAQQAGVQANLTYTDVNGNTVTTVGSFLEAVGSLKPGDEVRLRAVDGTEYTMLAVEHPESNSKGFIGVTGLEMRARPGGSPGVWLVRLLDVGGWLSELLLWLVMISLGIGMVNLLPLGPLDGGRMAQIAFQDIFGKQRGDAVWKHVSILILAMLALNLLLPLARSLVQAVL